MAKLAGLHDRPRQHRRCQDPAVAARRGGAARRGRGVNLPLDAILAKLHAVVLPYPAEAWRIADGLAQHRRDPLDRMLIGHAIHADLPIVTSDQTIRRYPVRTIW